MSMEDWKSPAAYDYAAKILDEGFAWEFLRRSHDYRTDHTAMKAKGERALDDAARHWGLRFPG
jgi:hypothetical protein